MTGGQDLAPLGNRMFCEHQHLHQGFPLATRAVRVLRGNKPLVPLSAVCIFDKVFASFLTFDTETLAHNRMHVS